VALDIHERGQQGALSTIRKLADALEVQPGELL
jgi:DNA-binding Xre family transcriptional regulator